MNCPRCANPLREQERSDILIDVCPKCRGVWLDRGELEKIVALERRAYDDDDDDDDGIDFEGAGRGRRGGFWENIMDLFGD